MSNLSDETVSVTPVEVFPRALSLSEHQELCDWLDMTDALRAAHAIDPEVERTWIEEMRRRDARELMGDDVPCERCGCAIFASGRSRLCPTCAAETEANAA